MKILLATPTYENMVTQHYHRAVSRLLVHYARHQRDVEIEPLTVSGTLIDRTRNVFATRVLQDRSFSHLLFVDSDMGFEPTLVEKMLAFGKPVVGCISPRRRNDYAALYQQARRTPDPNAARAAAQPYVLENSLLAEPSEPGKPARFRFIEGFVRVSQIGAGILLIERGVLEQMKARFPDLWVEEPGPDFALFPWCRDGLLQCFSGYRRPNGLFTSEDLAFSERWSADCGGELWACISEPITHVGRQTFTGAFLDKLRLAQSARVGEDKAPA